MAVSGAAILAYAGTTAGAATIGAGAAVASTGIAAYGASQAGKAAKAGQQPLVAPVKTQAAIDPNATRGSNAASALAGIPGTLLTGASGVNPNSLNTGKTLLGG